MRLWCVVAACACGAWGARQWEEVALLGDSKQPWGSYGDAVAVGEHHAATRVFVGAADGNTHKGLVRVVTETAGFAETARLRSPSQAPLDALGLSLSVHPNGNEVVAGAAGAPGAPGYVCVFRHTSSYGPNITGGGIGKDCLTDSNNGLITSDAYDPEWRLHQRITLGDEEAKVKDQFGRRVALNGDVLAVSSVNRRSRYAERDTVNTVHRLGTRDFIESYAGETPQDTVRMHYRRVQRDDVVKFEEVHALSGRGTLGKDFGAAMAFRSDGGLLAVTAPVRFDAVYGHGGSGDLVVNTGETTVLDGGGEFYFRSVTVRSGGVLTVTRRDAASSIGGRLIVKVQEDFVVEAGGVVTVDGLGYEGGPAAFRTGGHTDRARQGESTDSRGATETSTPNVGGGGSGTSDLVGVSKCVYDGSAPMFPDTYTPPDAATHQIGEASGGGGGYGTAGTNGTAVQCGVSGTGGDAHGDWATLDYGSGGGSGHPYSFGSGGSGGAGGGIIHIIARAVTNKGRITSNGNDGGDGGYYSGGGGGGSGGSIRLRGETLINEGVIEALGGTGGVRAVDSGSTGNATVKGGDGGKGRIQIAFVTVPQNGTFDPPPNDATATLFVGTVHVYNHTGPTAQDLAADPLAVGTWVEEVIETPAGGFYVGHSVALHGDYVAFGSSQRLSNASMVSAASVYIMRWALQGQTYGYKQHQEITPPEPAATTGYASARFGEVVEFFNGTMLIASVGDAAHPGVVWLYEQPAVDGPWTLKEWVTASTPAAGDGFGKAVSLSFSRTHTTLYVLSDALGLHVFQYQLPAPAPARSTLDCEYTAVTQGTATRCTLKIRDADNMLMGFQELADTFSVASDLATFTTTPLVTVAEGVFEFVYTPTATGSFQITVNDAGGSALASATGLEAFAPIDPLTTTFTCNETVDAGVRVTCVITTVGAVGEVSAAAYFEPTVYNTDLGELYPPFHEKVLLDFYNGQSAVVHRYVTGEVPGGTHPHETDTNYRVNPFHEHEEPTPVAWAAKGEYTFTFDTPHQGMYSVFMKYQNIPFGTVPNPFMVVASPPAVSAADSSFACDAVLPAGRIGSCIITLNGATGARTGDASAASSITTSLVGSGGNQVTVDAHLVWGGIGKYRFWFAAPAADDVYTVQVAHAGESIAGGTAAAVRVGSVRANAVCQAMPFLLSSSQIVKAHYNSYSDKGVYSTKATDVDTFPKEFCEAARV